MTTTMDIHMILLEIVFGFDNANILLYFFKYVKRSSTPILILLFRACKKEYYSLGVCHEVRPISPSCYVFFLYILIKSRAGWGPR
jgi:hypothetical protein